MVEGMGMGYVELHVPGERQDYQTVVVAMSKMELIYENEVGRIDLVGKVFIPSYWLAGGKQHRCEPRNYLIDNWTYKQRSWRNGGKIMMKT